MNWNFSRTLIGLFVMLSLPFSASAADNYTLDAKHSHVLWHINHFGFSNPTGKWMAEGKLVIDEEKPENSKVNATIQVTNFITGIPKLDEHLKEADFFDVAKYPTATFVSNKVNVTSKTTAKVDGTLTVRGVSKPVTLDVTLNKMGDNPMTNKKTLGFTASTTIKRSDFGLTKYLPNLGDEVKLNIEAEASKD